MPNAKPQALHPDERQWAQSAPSRATYTLNPTPYTLHTLSPTPYTLNPRDLNPQSLIPKTETQAMDAERGIEANSNSILERVQAAGDELALAVKVCRLGWRVGGWGLRV